jgi:hypothetical protein
MTVAQNNDAGIKPFSLHLEEVGENDDGTVTYNLDCSREDMEKLISVLFTHAVIEGIKSVKEENEQFLKLKEVAANLERFLRVWEESEVLDYDPEVKKRREALTNILYGENK